MMKNWRKFIWNCGKYLTLAALVFFTIRSLTIHVFTLPPENNYIVPAGRMIEPDNGSFSFAVASDTGAKNAPIERIVKEAQDGGNSFILYLGDLVRYRNISHFRWIVSELDEKLKFPFYMIPGNHEISNHFGKADKSLYKAVFGPLYYWFSYGDTMFIGLDSSEEKYSNNQLEWLEDTLNKIRPHFKYCIVYTHVPPISDPQWKKKLVHGQSTEKLKQILLAHDINLILSGHIHQYSQTNAWGIPLVTLMSSGQKSRSNINNYGYVTVNVSENGIGNITPHYLEDNLDDKNEYVELLLSSILVDERSLLIAVSMLSAGVLLLLIGAVVKCGR